MAQGSIGNLMPKEVAFQAENAGVIKANLDFFSTFMLALLAGAFIGFGAVFSTTILTGNGLDGAVKLPFGIIKSLGGAAFSLGLILVSVAGAEMFTGNVLLVMAAASRKITVVKVLRNWGMVFAGNFVGACVTAYLIFLSAQFTLMNNQVGATALHIAEAKCALTTTQAFMRAVFCNVLVCLAIWLSLSGRTVMDKAVAILFPVTAFITSGFEHCVANMYFIAYALFLKSGAPAEFWTALGTTPDAFHGITWGNFLLGNLLPVTLGNTVGGIMVGMMYWGIYCRPNLMMANDDADVLNRLTMGGRRKDPRIELDGTATLEFQGQEFHGKLRNIGREGSMIEVYEQTGLPSLGSRIELALSSGDGRLATGKIRAQIVAGNKAKNLMGRTYLQLSVKFVEVAEADQAAIGRLVG